MIWSVNSGFHKLYRGMPKRTVMRSTRPSRFYPPSKGSYMNCRFMTRQDCRLQRGFYSKLPVDMSERSPETCVRGRGAR
jgi:hypothetical protein